MQKTKTLSQKQHRALAALMSSPNLSAASVAAGCSRASLARWLREDVEFGKQYRLLRRQSYSQTTALLTSISGLAVRCLHDIITNPSEPPTSRVNAALGLLRLAQSGLDAESTAIEVNEALEFIELEKQNVRY